MPDLQEVMYAASVRYVLVALSPETGEDELKMLLPVYEQLKQALSKQVARLSA